MRRFTQEACQPRRLIFLLLLLVFAGCGDDDDSNPVAVNEDLREKLNLQPLPPVMYPPDNEPRQERISLGKLLFFDPIISGEKNIACGTCHHPNFAFADRRQFSAGVSGEGLGPDRVLTNATISLEPRNSPTILNAAMNLDESGLVTHEGFQFLDGRVRGLEEQASRPITSRVEMRGDGFGGATDRAVIVDSVLARLREVPEYLERFKAAFPVEAVEVEDGERASIIDSSTYARAIACYERELVTRNSAYDRYVSGDDNALNATELHGLELFFGKAKCGVCHAGPMFSDYRFIVQGVPQEGGGKDIMPGDDTGREEHTLDTRDRYAFRTLTLRNVELTPPYMHDGCFETLEEVVRFYNVGSFPRHPAVTNDLLDPDLRDPLGLDDEEVDAVVAFMKTLTDMGTGLDPYLLQVPKQVPSGLTPVFGLNDGGSGKGR